MDNLQPHLNALEPAWYLDTFERHPPHGFLFQNVGGGPGFLMRLDLSTTLHPKLKRWLQFVWNVIPKPLTLFVGTPISEYAPLKAEVSAEHLIAQTFTNLAETRASAVVFKDLPLHSPLLTRAENALSESLIEELEGSGFEIVTGEALAFVPIDFRSTQDYLARFSAGRRKDFARKLKHSQKIKITEHVPGTDKLSDQTLDHIYRLYLGVYNQSSVHFDKLSPAFFRQILTTGNQDTRLFLYWHAGEIVAFNYCLVARRYLIDKYIGFDYRVSRELNLYFVSWFQNLEYCLRHNLNMFVAGWTDPEIKARLGAQFTFTYHAVYFKSAVLRFVFHVFKSLFESDKTLVTSNIAPAPQVNEN